MTATTAPAGLLPRSLRGHLAQPTAPFADPGAGCTGDPVVTPLAGLRDRLSCALRHDAQAKLICALQPTQAAKLASRADPALRLLLGEGAAPVE
jgi:hypothetical protein